MNNRIGHLGLSALVVVLVLWPLVGAIERPGRIFNALAADTFYYAALARNLTQHGFFSIDAVTLSNGYMPLWQLIVAALDRLIAGPGTAPVVLLQAIFWVSAGLVACGLAGLVWFVSRRFGWAVALVCLPLIVPGAGLFLLDHSFRDSLPVGVQGVAMAWSQVNGMESGIGLALFAVFLPLAARSLDTPARGIAFWSGAVAFLIFMARLDDVFLGIAFGLCLLAIAVRTGDLRPVPAAALVPVIGSLGYLAINMATGGAPLPTSGMLKTQLFSFPTGWAEFTSIARVDHLDSRMLPLATFLVIGVLGLASQLARRHRGRLTPVVVMLSGYLVLKSGFLLSSVALHEQGHWYYTNMLAAMNILIAIAVASCLQLTPRAITIAAPVLVALVVVTGANVRAQLERFPPTSYATVVRDLCMAPEPVQAVLPEDSRIIDTSDGFYAFCLGRPAVTLTGLADSRSFNDRRNVDGFYDAALSAGHDILVASPVPFASYDWQGVLKDKHKAVPIETIGLVSVWRIERAN